MEKVMEFNPVKTMQKSIIRKLLQDDILKQMLNVLLVIKNRTRQLRRIESTLDIENGTEYMKTSVSSEQRSVKLLEDGCLRLMHGRWHLMPGEAYLLAYCSNYSDQTLKRLPNHIQYTLSDHNDFAEKLECLNIDIMTGKERITKDGCKHD